MIQMTNEDPNAEEKMTITETTEVADQNGGDVGRIHIQDLLLLIAGEMQDLDPARQYEEWTVMVESSVRGPSHQKTEAELGVPAEEGILVLLFENGTVMMIDEEDQLHQRIDLGSNPTEFEDVHYHQKIARDPDPTEKGIMSSVGIPRHQSHHQNQKGELLLEERHPLIEGNHIRKEIRATEITETGAMEMTTVEGTTEGEIRDQTKLQKTRRRNVRKNWQLCNKMHQL